MYGRLTRNRLHLSTGWLKEDVMKTVDPAVCPYCGKRNTCEMGPPSDAMGDLTWDWECHDCGKAYVVEYAPVKIRMIEGQEVED